MGLRNTGQQVKALLPADVGDDLDELKSRLGLITSSNVIALAIRRLANAELSERQYRNQTTSSGHNQKEVA